MSKNVKTKMDIAREVAMASGFAIKDCTYMIDAIFATIMRNVKAGDEVVFRGFGVYGLKHVPERTRLVKLNNKSQMYKTPAHDEPTFSFSKGAKQFFLD